MIEKPKYPNISKLGELSPPAPDKLENIRETKQKTCTLFSQIVLNNQEIFQRNGELSTTEIEKGNQLISDLILGYELVHLKFLGIKPKVNLFWDDTPSHKNEQSKSSSRSIFFTVDDENEMLHLGVNIDWFTNFLKHENETVLSVGKIRFDTSNDHFLFAGFEEGAHAMRYAFTKQKHNNVDENQIEDPLDYIFTDDYEYQAFLIKMIMAKIYFKKLYYEKFNKIFLERKKPEIVDQPIDQKKSIKESILNLFFPKK